MNRVRLLQHTERRRLYPGRKRVPAASAHNSLCTAWTVRIRKQKASEENIHAGLRSSMPLEHGHRKSCGTGSCMSRLLHRCNLRTREGVKNSGQTGRLKQVPRHPRSIFELPQEDQSWKARQ